MAKKHVFAGMVVVVAFVSGTAHAAPITFTHSGSGTGGLGGVFFGNRSFTITATGDTDARVLADTEIYSITHTSAQISIDGLGTYSILVPTRTFVNNRTGAGLTSPAVGFSWAGGGGADLFNGPRNAPAFETWHLNTSIGPIVGNGQLLQWSGAFWPDVQTSGGVLAFNDQATVATFTAVVVPAPGAFALFGLAATLSSRRRR